MKRKLGITALLLLVVTMTLCAAPSSAAASAAAPAAVAPPSSEHIALARSYVVLNISREEYETMLHDRLSVRFRSAPEFMVLIAFAQSEQLWTTRRPCQL